MSDFVHLHSHGHHSLMDGLNTPDEMAAVAVELGQHALALTDHGTLSGHRDMQAAAKQRGIKPILGVEAYISPTDRFDRRAVAKRDDNTQAYNHVVLLARDEPGLKNLHHMSREAWQSGFYSKPRIDWDLLNEYGDGIIVLSGCLNGLIPKAFERGEPDEALRIAQQYKERFGGDFYIEVQAHNPYATNRALFDLAKQVGIRTVATADCHFTRPELRWVEESMLILSTSPKAAKDESYATTKGIKNIFDRLRTLYPDRPISFEEIDVYMMNRLELEQGFKQEFEAAEYNEALDSTLEIADKIGEYDYIEGKDFLPRISDDPDKDLADKVFAGLDAMGLGTNPDYVARAKEELEILRDKRFAPYFLVVEDAVSWARSQGIFVGPGRGSAAGSLVCYSLGITRVDPIEYDLLFFRFIDLERNDWPDIDIDFEKSRRGEVKEYLQQKYGYVASISNFNYFRDKGVIRDAARVFMVPVKEVNDALKQVEKWDDFMSTGAEATVRFRQRYPEVIELAEHLRGRIRSVGMHAAGVVASSVPIEDYAPFETRSDPDDKVSGRVPVVAWDMKQCESLGFIKLDILGLKTLDVLHNAVDFVKERHDVDIDLESLPLNDKRVYKAFNEGVTQGVFQAEGSTNRQFLMEVQPTEFEDLVAATSLTRPGALNTVGDVFLNRRHGREQVSYVHEIMEPILRDTYGTIVYQEQVMLAATELGGMSRADSNNLRRIIGKKRDAAEFEEYRERFLSGAEQHIERAVAEQLWHDFEAHAGYSFNRSHAVAYSLLTYWSMWLKLYYPVEFMTALFRQEHDKDKRLYVLIEMRRLGLDVRLPSLVKSGKEATIDGDSIRLGLTDIKYISDLVYGHLREHLPINSYAELKALSDQKGSGINSRAVDALSRVGAVPGLQADHDSLYEYLRVPKFKGQELPADILERFTLLEDYDEVNTHIIKAMVTSLKRGKIKSTGKEWVRVEMVDETGKAGIFCNPEDTPEEGQMYAFLVTFNRIYASIPIDDFTPDSEHALAQFVYNGSEAPLGKVQILSVENRFTAKRQMMATLVVTNSDNEMRRVLVFPGKFAKVSGKLKVGNISRVKLKKLEDGALMLQEME